MKPKEIKLILKAQRTVDDNIIYSVEFLARDIMILCWVNNFMQKSSSRHKTAILKEVATAATFLSYFTFIIGTRKDSPKEEIDFINEVYDMLAERGNDVLFEER